MLLLNLEYDPLDDRNIYTEHEPDEPPLSGFQALALESQQDMGNLPLPNNYKQNIASQKEQQYSRVSCQIKFNVKLESYHQD